MFSHIAKWKRGEWADEDSGAHHLVHTAWRCLAIACIETGNVPTEPVLMPVTAKVGPVTPGDILEAIQEENGVEGLADDYNYLRDRVAHLVDRLADYEG